MSRALLVLFSLNFLLTIFSFTVQQFHIKQHSCSCNCGFIWDVHFVRWESDACTSFYLTFSLCCSTVSLKHASKFDHTGLFVCLFMNYEYFGKSLSISNEFIMFILQQRVSLLLVSLLLAHTLHYTWNSDFEGCECKCVIATIGRIVHS